MTSKQSLSISVIMPAYKAAHLLERVLPPLLEMRASGAVAEVIVVDDQSPDDTAQKAREMGAEVLVTPQNGGPGVARNLAAKQAKGDILWFVDSDVIAWPGGAEKITAAFEDPQVDAVFGSYDADPDGRYWFSRYKNLLHRYHHQTARRDATTFWAGCGAVRASAFDAVNGFDVETYRVPSIEDIELGYRIRSNGGRIVVMPDLQSKHLKVWTLKNAIFTDIFRRALPWSRLMISREGLTNDLNTGFFERIRAGIAGLFILALFATLVVPGAAIVALVLAVVAVAINWNFVAFMYRNGGFLFAAASILYHQVYYVYSTASYVWCLFEYHILGRKNRLHVP